MMNTHGVNQVWFAMQEKLIFIDNVCLTMLCHAFIAVPHQVTIHLGDLENTQEARVALSCAWSNCCTSFLFCKFPAYTQ